MDLRTRIAATIRRERERTGMSASELARRAGVSKATVSQLETAALNPTVETLWAIGDALGVPFSTLVDDIPTTTTLIRAADRAGVPSAAAPYVATLLAASPPHARRDLFVLDAEPGGAHVAQPHPAGAIEHVVLTSGRAEVGPVGSTVHLSPGDYMAYPADVPHVFTAMQPGTSAVLLTELR